MAKLVLQNDIKMATSSGVVDLKRGRIYDDTTDDVASVRAAGGVLSPLNAQNGTFVDSQLRQYARGGNPTNNPGEVQPLPVDDSGIPAGWGR